MAVTGRWLNTRCVVLALFAAGERAVLTVSSTVTFTRRLLSPTDSLTITTSVAKVPAEGGVRIE